MLHICTSNLYTSEIPDSLHCWMKSIHISEDYGTTSLSFMEESTSMVQNIQILSVLLEMVLSCFKKTALYFGEKKYN